MRINAKRSGVNEETLTVKMSGELDHHAADSLKHAIDNEIDKQACNVLVLDMTDVTFMDSSGLGVILGRYRIMEKNKGKVYIFGANRGIDRIFKMSGIYKLVTKIEKDSIRG